MKNAAIKVGILILYFVLLSKVMGLDPGLLLNMPFIVMVLSGAFLLTLLDFRKGNSKYQVIESFKHSLILIGYIVTFFANIAFLSNNTTMKDSFKNIIINFLPLFYAYFLHTVVGFFNINKPIESESELKNSTDSNFDNLEDYDLTRRETVVAKELMSELSNSEIGAKLFISESTIKKHINHIYQKVGVRNRMEFILRFDRRRKGEE